MSYAEMNTVPAYERVRMVDGRIAPPLDSNNVLWGNDESPPAVGDEIVVRINNCGLATVTGYFTQEGFLGLRCRLHNPPEWHVKQNNGNPNGHVFGPEFRRA